MSSLSNATQRAVRRFVGGDTFEILIPTVANQGYTLTLDLPTNIRIRRMTAQTASGTCTLNLQKVVAGTPSSVAGLSAFAASATKASADATNNGTNDVAASDGLQVSITANAVGVSLSITVEYDRTSGAQ